MRRRIHVPILAATALTMLVGACVSAASPTGSESDGAERPPTSRPVATADPVGAEEWMYLQRANPDGSIPDAAVSEAIAQSTSMNHASPSTEQVWAELGPSNIGGRV